MPDQTVKVTFDKATQKFTFVKNSVTMTAAGKVILNQDGKVNWMFTGATVKDDTLRQFSVKIPGVGNVLHIDDAFKDKEKTAYQYNITVTEDGKTYTSPDPEIVNDPP